MALKQREDLALKPDPLNFTLESDLLQIKMNFDYDLY